MRLLLAFLLLANAPLVSVGADAAGFLDGADCTHLYGWTSAPKVNLYVDGKFSKTVTANLPRPDVAAAGFGLNHGFDFKLPPAALDGKKHTFAVKVTGTTYELQHSPVALTCGGAPAVSPTPCPPCPCADPSPTATPSATPVATATPTPSPAGSPIDVTLIWNASSGTDVRYHLHYGNNGTLGHMQPAGPLPLAVVSVTRDEPWRFAVTAFNATGGESPLSGEVKFP